MAAVIYNRKKYTLNYSVDDFPSCCGGDIVHDFQLFDSKGEKIHSGANGLSLNTLVGTKDNKFQEALDKLGEQLAEELEEEYSGSISHIVAMAVKDGDEVPWQYPLLKAAGFEESGESENPNSGNILVVMTKVLGE